MAHLLEGLALMPHSLEKLALMAHLSMHASNYDFYTH